ncbi:MAG: YlxR family protein [Lachnospiraceae bacterium]|nr:YlxR family protein [Lachnospiraceae bacterium]
MANKKIPARVCVGCKEMKPKRELVRIVKTNEDEIKLDLTGRMNGRGAYICNHPDCLAKAIKTKGLERSLKVSIPPEVIEELTKEMNANAK